MRVNTDQNKQVMMEIFFLNSHLSAMDGGMPASSSHSLITLSLQEIPCGCNKQHFKIATLTNSYRLIEIYNMQRNENIIGDVVKKLLLPCLLQQDDQAFLERSFFFHFSSLSRGVSSHLFQHTHSHEHHKPIVDLQVAE